MNEEQKQSIAAVIVTLILMLISAIAVGAYFDYGILGPIVTFFVFGIMVWSWSDLIR